MFCNCSIVFFVYYFAIITGISEAVAQPADPLQIERSDPLIPKGYGKRELSSFEKYRLQKEIVKLDKNAKNKLNRGNASLAMELWYRRLRLTRIIGTKAEIKALGKIGAIAWQENFTDDVRNIANRLSAIQTTEAMDKNVSFELLNDLALAYESVRYLDKAIDIYEQISLNRTNKNKIIDKLGELYLDVFDYDNAAKIYQQKLKGDISPKKQETIFKTLVEIYDKTQQVNRSIDIKKQLVKHYIRKNKRKEIPALKIAIAQDYETLTQAQKAISFYQQAFDTALKNKQLAIASDALTKRGKLQQEKNIKQAIDTYNKLITVQQQSYNYYGLINTYDTLGKIYLKSNKPNKAKQFFQQGLNVAITLNYRIKYFRDRLKSVNP